MYSSIQPITRSSTLLSNPFCNNTNLYAIFLFILMTLFTKGLSTRLFTSKYLYTNKQFNSIQVIYDSLVSISKNEPEIIKNTVHPLQSNNIRNCLNEMNKIKLSDLGFDIEDIDSLDESVCANIITSKDFSLAVFLIPKGNILPLHDHPSMTVISKVIYGSLDIKSYSLIKLNNSLIINNSGYIAANLSYSTIKTEKDPAWYLTSTNDNLHEFKALSTCVILDIFLPPYEEPERSCCFYKAIYDETLLKWWLKKIPEDPKDLPYTIEYPGIRPIVNGNDRKIIK